MDCTDGFDEFDAGGFFEEVAAGAGLERPVDVFAGGVHGEDDDFGVGADFPDVGGGFDAVEFGHGDVEDEDIWLDVLEFLEGFTAVYGHVYDFDVWLVGEEQAQPV